MKSSKLASAAKSASGRSEMPMPSVSWDLLAKLALQGYGGNFNLDNQFPVNLWLGQLAEEGRLTMVEGDSTLVGLVVLGLDPANDADAMGADIQPLVALKGLAGRWVADSDSEASKPFWKGVRLLLQRLNITNGTGILFMNLYPFYNDRAQEGSNARRQATIDFLSLKLSRVPILMLGKSRGMPNGNELKNTFSVYHPSSHGYFYNSLLNPPDIFTDKSHAHQA